ncbi:MAG: sigma 54-interacting transcriptional regulator [Syntrophaceae bacterium]|nr:sigma 54-interacting transcriptional regulator [Syntrophaceae bacterium]
MDKKIKLGIVASSLNLLNSARQIADEKDMIAMHSLSGLEDAIQPGKEMERAGVEVIVSRGGTANILRRNLSIPVLSVSMTHFDILASIKRALVLGKRILLLTYGNKVSGISILGELLDIDLTQAIYYDSNDIENIIIESKTQGYDVLITGGVSTRLAKKHGMKFVGLETAKETITSVLEDAEAVARSHRKKQAETERYRCIVESTSDGIIAIDQYGLITTINEPARIMLKISDADIIGKNISDVLPNTSIMKVMKNQQPIFNKIETVNKDLFVCNHIAIKVGSDTVGALSTFRDISNVMKAENEVRRSLAKGLVAKYSTDDIIHKSRVMKEVITKAKKFAGSGLTILITGETGTGKELLAHSIHNLGPRRQGPFVSINCAALPEQLLESELFGYAEGAFTGAKRGGKPGLFELAHKGTVFLDEISTMSHSVQARLLRVLQEKEVMRIGGDCVIPVDISIIAASNRQLIDEVKQGRLREDLYFRLNVLNIIIPPLRERLEDIPLLINKLIAKASGEIGLKTIEIPPAYMEILKEYDWPGNVRQVENFINRLILLSDSIFDPNLFFEVYRQLVGYQAKKEVPDEGERPNLIEHLKSQISENESRMILETLKEVNFSKTKAARKLGISRTTLWRKLKNEIVKG